MPSGFREFEPLMTYLNAEDTGFLTLYVLYTPKKPRKLERCEKLWRKQSLILVLLLLAGIEQNPGEFYQYHFYYYYYCVVLNKICKNICHLYNLSLTDLKS